MKKITLKNIGPIDSLEIPLPEGGGVVELRGSNGSGKSHAQAAIERMLTGNGKVPVRDGELMGSVDATAIGATLVVAKSTRVLGALEVQHLDGKANIGDFIDPKVDSPEAADRKRINTLLKIFGVGASKELFTGLLNGKADFDEIVRADSIVADDVVLTATKVKRDLEAAARHEEKAAGELEAKVKVQAEQLGTVDLSLAENVSTLSEAMSKAISKNSALQEKAKTAKQILAAAEEAKKSLQAAEANYTGATVAQAETDARNAEIELRQLEQRLAEVRADLQVKKERLASARRHDESVAAFKAIVEKSAGVSLPSEDELAQANARAAEARFAYDAANNAARLKELARQLEENKVKLAAHVERGELLRNAAKGTDEVLSSLIKSDEIKVEAGRLVTQTKRGKTFFADLSDGERCAFAIRLAAKALGENGLLVADQPFWEGLDENNKAICASTAKECGVTIIAAHAQVGELHAKIYEGE